MCLLPAAIPQPAVATGWTALPLGPVSSGAVVHCCRLIAFDSPSAAMTSGSWRRNAVEPLQKPATISG
ncbi:hypothetical protein AB0N06_22140 [Streptomyces sp. NPDC051020]|uniref:hypothetical protein n=1 Tax=Streptomyces sp. NPDC051020 TaxID=3155409 RepID=UPI00343E1230